MWVQVGDVGWVGAVGKMILQLFIVDIKNSILFPIIYPNRQKDSGEDNLWYLMPGDPVRLGLTSRQMERRSCSWQ